MKFLLLAIAFLTSCATTLTPDGALRVEGNVKNLNYERHADGSTRLTGDFDHSTATHEAVGEVKAVGAGLAGLGVGAMIH